MKEKVNLNKILKIVLIVAILIITASVSYYLVFLPKKTSLPQKKLEEDKSEEWIFFAQSDRYLPIFVLPGLSLNQCKYIGVLWVDQPSIINGIYECCSKCKLKETGGSINCKECYGYDENGFVAYDEWYFPSDLFWGNLPLEQLMDL